MARRRHSRVSELRGLEGSEETVLGSAGVQAACGQHAAALGRVHTLATYTQDPTRRSACAGGPGESNICPVRLEIDHAFAFCIFASVRTYLPSSTVPHALLIV
jgi:hypothetical protein